MIWRHACYLVFDYFVRRSPWSTTDWHEVIELRFTKLEFLLSRTLLSLRCRCHCLISMRLNLCFWIKQFCIISSCSKGSSKGIVRLLVFGTSATCLGNAHIHVIDSGTCDSSCDRSCLFKSVVDILVLGILSHSSEIICLHRQILFRVSCRWRTYQC